MVLSCIQADALGGLGMIGEGFGTSDNAFYGLAWRDSAWVIRWRMDHQSGRIESALAPAGKTILLWKTHALTDPPEHGYLLSTEVTDGAPGPVDTVGLAYGDMWTYAVAASPRRRWVVWMDRRPGDLNQRDFRFVYSDVDGAWREGPTLRHDANGGLTCAALDDTTLLLVWSDLPGGLRWGTLRGSFWAEGGPPPTPYWAAWIPRLSPRRGGGYWLGWLQTEQEPPYSDYAAISSFQDGQWSPPESVRCGYPSARQWLSDSHALSREPADYPVVAWNAYGGGFQDHSCVSCPTDSGPSVAEAISSTSTRSGPEAAIDANGDVWVAWWIFGNTTYWVHTYTRAFATAPAVEEGGGAPVIRWSLTEPAPLSWWAVLRAQGSRGFELAGRVRAGLSTDMAYRDQSPGPGALVRYRIRRESLDSRYQWLSEEVVWQRELGLSLELESANPCSDRIELRMCGAPAGPIMLRLFDTQGREAARQLESADGSGLDRWSFALSRAGRPLATGLYFLKANDNAGRTASGQKVAIIRR